MTIGEVEELISKTEQNITRQTLLIERLNDRGHNMTEAKKMLAVLITSLQNLYTYREQFIRIRWEAKRWLRSPATTINTASLPPV